MQICASIAPLISGIYALYDNHELVGESRIVAALQLKEMYKYFPSNYILFNTLFCLAIEHKLFIIMRMILKLLVKR